MKKIVLPVIFLALAGNAYAAKESIYTKNAPQPIGVYSQATKNGTMVYLSGQIPLDPATGNLVEGSFRDQVKQVMMNLSAVATAAGGNLNDVVKLTVYLSDLSNFAVVNEVMNEYLQAPYPARAVVEVKALPKHATVEIEAIMQL